MDIRTGPAQRWLRIGLIYLTVQQTVIGLWQYLLPRAFYDHFPTVSLDPPYNEHLMSDVGGLGLSLAVMLLGAAYYLEYRLVAFALLGNFVYAGTHFVFHVTSFDGFSTSEAVVVGVTLGAFVVVPTMLLILARRVELDGWRARDPEARPGHDALS
jgi:hypothetical protein